MESAKERKARQGALRIIESSAPAGSDARARGARGCAGGQIGDFAGFAPGAQGIGQILAAIFFKRLLGAVREAMAKAGVANGDKEAYSGVVAFADGGMEGALAAGVDKIGVPGAMLDEPVGPCAAPEGDRLGQGRAPELFALGGQNARFGRLEKVFGACSAVLRPVQGVAAVPVAGAAPAMFPEFAESGGAVFGQAKHGGADAVFVIEIRIGPGVESR